MIGLQNITVVTIKVVMYTTGDCIHFVSRFLFQNKWFHYWLEENERLEKASDSNSN